MTKVDAHIVGAIGQTAVGVFRFTHRYTDDAPRGLATLWAMSDGTVRWRDVATNPEANKERKAP